MILLLRLFISFILISSIQGYLKGPQHVQATKGKFFSHTLHSANFFRNTVKVKWEVTLNNKPALPSWLRLMPSRHPEIAYLIGTPVTTATQVTLHVIAKRLDNFEIEQKMLVVNLIEDYKFHGTTKQIFDLPLNNVEVEEFVSNRDKKIDQLENSLRNTFRGKNVNPYIADIRPKYNVPKGKEFIFNNKFGTVVTVGTQQRFYPGTIAMVQNLHSNDDICTRPSNVAMDKYFSPVFIVDWCNISLKNVSSVDEEEFKKFTTSAKKSSSGKSSKITKPVDDKIEAPPQEVYGYSGYNFWNSVILFPAIGIVCVLLLLVLSIIFFGSREGQKWRDYKTSRETLEEFISVRESQKHLRELSVQRQLVSMSQENAAPTGIHSFLQPRSRAPSTIARFSKSASRLNDREDTVELLPAADHIPVGKQTVAEAAKQCGSSLHLYRNPLDSEQESDEQDSDCSEEN